MTATSTTATAARSTALVLLLTLMLLAGSGQAGAADGPELRTERTYFTCDRQATHFEALIQPITHDFTWDLTAPTEQFQDPTETMPGCYMATSEYLKTNHFEPAFAGTFTGNLDSLTVELWRALGRPTSSDANDTLVVSIVIDGEERFHGAVLPEWGGPHDVMHRARFTLRDIGLDSEPGEGVIGHTVRIEVKTTSDLQHLGWDNTDAPAGITFNPEQPELVAVDAR